MAKIENGFRIFPQDFIWGTATAAYQIEGAADEDGRGKSTWDTFSHAPGNVWEGHTGDVACDHYHKYKEDILLMKSMGVQNYRFSIAWPRLFPDGNPHALNEKGKQFYDDLINELIKNDITPSITLFHWDLPQTLEDAHMGWLGRETIEAFVGYAEKCFEFYGDRVKTWLTFNEPWCTAVLGYATGDHAPGRWADPGSEPYTVAHNLILAHAGAVKVYREKFKEQGGKIGLTLNTNWWEPLSDNDGDIAASVVALEFSVGWFASPIFVNGDYPEIMKELVGDRMPKFTDEEKQLIKGSSDFFGLNHYTTTFCGVPSVFRHLRNLGQVLRMNTGGMKGFQMARRILTSRTHYFKDMNVLITIDHREGMTDMGWPINPWGLRKLLEYLQNAYPTPGGIYVFENGCAMKEDIKRKSLKDANRLEYMYKYISEAHQAMMNGVDLKGFYYWSFMDNYEWACGYAKRFGLVHVDYTTQERTVKASGKWFGKVCQENRFPVYEDKSTPNLGYQVIAEVLEEEEVDALRGKKHRHKHKHNHHRHQHHRQSHSHDKENGESSSGQPDDIKKSKRKSVWNFFSMSRYEDEEKGEKGDKSTLHVPAKVIGEEVMVEDGSSDTEESQDEIATTKGKECADGVVDLEQDLLSTCENVKERRDENASNKNEDAVIVGAGEYKADGGVPLPPPKGVLQVEAYEVDKTEEKKKRKKQKVESCSYDHLPAEDFQHEEKSDAVPKAPPKGIHGEVKNEKNVEIQQKEKIDGVSKALPKESQLDSHPEEAKIEKKKKVLSEEGAEAGGKRGDKRQKSEERTCKKEKGKKKSHDSINEQEPGENVMEVLPLGMGPVAGLPGVGPTE